MTHKLINPQYTVAPALTAAVFLVIYCASSDYFLDRGFHMAAVQIPTIIGYAILMAVNVTTQRGVSYFAIFLCTIGVSQHTHPGCLNSTYHGLTRP